MAAISPFKAFRPNPMRADALVFAEEKRPADGSEHQVNGYAHTLKSMLESGARVRPELPETQERAYKQINQKVEELMENGDIWHEQHAGFYVYEIAHPKYRQTGIWALTDIEDYTTGRIKTHENTFPDSVRRLRNYREYTGLEGSPVLLTYAPTVAINRIIAETKKKNNKQVLGDRNCFHRFWKIEDEPTKRRLIKAFADVSSVYLADGHHRLAAAAKLKAKMHEEGNSGRHTVSSLYIAADQLRICEFNRVFIPEKQIDQTAFFDKLSAKFLIRRKMNNTAFQPRKDQHIGMYFGGNWYDLYVKHMPQNGVASKLNVSLLQKQLLGPLLGVDDPATDARLKCVGGANTFSDIEALLLEHPQAIAFTLSPLSVEQLIAVSDANEILPPKSTWIDPKVPFGLIMFK